MTKIAPRSSVVEYDSDGPIEGKIPRAPVKFHWRWEVASRTRCRQAQLLQCVSRENAGSETPVRRTPAALLGTKCCPSA